MRKISWYLVLCYAVWVLVIVQHVAMAEYYDVGGLQVSMDGYLRQEFSFNTNDRSSVNMDGLQSAYSILYMDASTEFNRSLDARIITRLWADWAYQINKDDSHWEKYFDGAREELNFLDDFDDIVREAYVTYSSLRFLVRVGRQQVGWGESDGLRLMDVINPLDLRRGPFYDTQGYSEVRIPKWLLKAEIYPGNIGPMANVALQLIWNPGDIRENLQLQLPLFVDAHLAPDARVMPNTAGVWAVETGLGHSLPFNLEKKYRTDSIKNSEFGARLSFSLGDTFMTLNFWHGFAHEHLFKYNRIDYHPQGRVIPTPMGMVPMAVYADLIYPRITYAGITANHELAALARLLGVATNPIFRFEALYSFDQDMNSSEVVPNPVDPVNAPPLDVNKIIESDQIRWMLGFDWPVRWRWINPSKNVFVSAQFFHIYTVDMPPSPWDIVPDSSAYFTWDLTRNQTFASLLLRTEYLNERLVPSVLYVEDIRCAGRWAVAELAYKIGDHWRPSLRYLFIDGDSQRSFGVYRTRDEVTLRIQYQF